MAISLGLRDSQAVVLFEELQQPIDYIFGIITLEHACFMLSQHTDARPTA
jgi:hypothetical protein